MKVRMIITALMMVITIAMYAQSIPVTTDSIRNAEYREKIGLDMTVPDFETKKIDGKVMGTRLAGILEYLLENYKQASYERQIALILGEQYEALKNKFFNLKKMKFISASKKGNDLTILMKVWPDKNTRNVKTSGPYNSFL